MGSGTRKIYTIISFFEMNIIKAIGSRMYTVLGNSNKIVLHSGAFSCDRKYFLKCIFHSEVSHDTTQLYRFTLCHGVLLHAHVTIHKFWVVYLFDLYLSDISPLKRSLLFVMYLCMAKMSTGIFHCKQHESACTPDDNVTVTLREVIRVLLNGEKDVDSSYYKFP